ncbi:optic atrophy 3 protein homolog isoform X1 [Lycorma delicatula]|uniref:optic atrophy 3 protein homolog isoform X1 n=1 Tax=Lycorma delicatula TaxID=130591 RepID=UPI003F5186FD
MVIQAFPAAKLGALLLRQISKPIATFIKEKAKGHPFFRTYVCMPPAHFYNWCEVKVKMWMLNLGKPVSVPPLNEAMAIELGGNLLGEAIIFFIAASLLFLEYNRQVRKEEKKEAARKEELGTLNYTIQELYFQIERQDAQIRELHREIYNLGDQVVRKPWKPKQSSPTPPPPPSPPSDSPSVTPKKSAENTDLNKPQNNINTATVKHHFHHRHHEVIPIHLEHINKVVADNPGVVLTAVAYLTNEIFNVRNEYYTQIHLQSQH